MRMRTSNSSEACELPCEENRCRSLLNAASSILLAYKLRQTAERPSSKHATQWGSDGNATCSGQEPELLAVLLC
jgi:hypothetical protein